MDEIIIIDQNSTDKTIQIAKKFTDKIFPTSSEDFSKNRNLLASYAKGDWLLYLDADERLTTELIDEIKSSIELAKSPAYYMPRQNFILGRQLRYGGWWPDYVPRLFRARYLIGWQGKIHESPKIKGEFGYFRNSLRHHTARSLSMMLTKSTKWAKVEANLFHDGSNPKVSAIKLLHFSSSEFISRYFIKLGFLDGSIGLISALYQALHKAMIFTYLWELQNNSQEKFNE